MCDLKRHHSKLLNNRQNAFVIYAQNYAAWALPILFIPPKNPYSKQANQNTPGLENLKPKKSFYHPCHLKSWVPPLGAQ